MSFAGTDFRIVSRLDGIPVLHDSVTYAQYVCAFCLTCTAETGPIRNILNSTQITAQLYQITAALALSMYIVLGLRVLLNTPLKGLTTWLPRSSRGRSLSSSRQTVLLLQREEWVLLEWASLICRLQLRPC